MTPVRLEPAAPRSRVKHSTTEPLRSLVKSTGLPRVHFINNEKGKTCIHVAVSDKLAFVSQRPMLICSLRKREVPGSIHNKVCNYTFLCKLFIRAHVKGAFK